MQTCQLSLLCHNPRLVKLAVTFCHITSEEFHKKKFPAHVVRHFKRCTSTGTEQLGDAHTVSSSKLCLEYYDFSTRRFFKTVRPRVRFSSLTSLELKACIGVKYLLQSMSVAPEGVQLKSLKILGIANNCKYFGYNPPHNCYSRFLASFEGLEELALDDYGLDLDFVKSIAPHGITLRKLEIHEYCRTRTRARGLNFDGYSEPDFMNLQGLQGNCPNLQDLHLDLLRVDNKLNVSRSHVLSLSTDRVSSVPRRGWTASFFFKSSSTYHNVELRSRRGRRDWQETTICPHT